MKGVLFYLSFILMGVFCFAKPAMSQDQGWEWLNPLPQGDGLRKIFFVDQEHGWISSDGPKLLRIQDGGTNWEILGTGIIFTDIHFTNHSEGWSTGHAHTGDRWSVYHTTDGGETWEVQLADTTTRYSIFFLDENLGWAANNKIGSDELLVTKDGGKTWQSQAEGLFRGNDKLCEIFFLDEMTGWATGGGFFGIRTTDGGHTWERDSSLVGVKQLFFIDSQYGWARHSNWFVSRTSDGGKTWIRYRVSESSDDGTTHFFAVDTNTCFLATNKRLYASGDGGRTWAEHSPQPLNSFFFFDSLEAVATTENKILNSYDGGKTWENNYTKDSLPGDILTIKDVDFIDANTGWIIGSRTISTGSSIFRTTDGGKSWQSQWSDQNIRLNEVTFLDENNGWAVGSTGTILHSNDGGLTWKPQSSPTDLTLLSAAFVDASHGWAVGYEPFGNQGIILHTNNGGQIWIDQSPGKIQSLADITFVDTLNGWAVNKSIFRTRDGGQTWFSQREATALASVSFIDTLSGWATGVDPATRANVIHTTDGGKTWIPQYSASGFFKDIQFLDQRNGWVVGLFGIMFHTTDGGNSWQEQQSNTSQGLVAVDFIDLRRGWAVGWNRTILHTSPETPNRIWQKQPQTISPNHFVLIGNYPNPFNAATKIRLKIFKSNAKVRLSIYNLVGQRVRQLIDEERAPGIHDVVWDGLDQYGNESASGLYFYRLEVNGTIQVGKAMLLR